MDEIRAGSTALAADQLCPLKVMTPPDRSPAAQNLGVAHDTASSAPSLDTSTGFDQRVPLNVTTLMMSVAAQNVRDVHDTDSRLPAGSTVTGLDHRVPLNVTALPPSR